MTTSVKEEVKHTALPWVASEEYDGWVILKKEKNPEWFVNAKLTIASGIEQGASMGEADAKFIVEACNLYYELKKQNQDLDLELQRYKRLVDMHPEKDLMQQNHELLEALKEAKLQIEYLHQKFTATGSGNAVLAQIENVISKSNINEQ